MEWQQRTCISTHTHTKCNMDGNYIHACLKSLRGRGSARKGHTHNNYTFPVCIGKVCECVSIKCEGGDFVLFLCTPVSVYTSVTYIHMHICK